MSPHKYTAHVAAVDTRTLRKENLVKTISKKPSSQTCVPQRMDLEGAKSRGTRNMASESP